jgi:hypothetical protein
MTLTIDKVQSKYAKCVSSLLFKVQKRGLRLSSVGPAGGNTVLCNLEDCNELDTRRDVADIVCDLDKSNVLIRDEAGSVGFLFIVLGNDKGEILSDYGLLSSNSKEEGAELMKLLDEVADEFYEQWG